jgi:hypothetical protein
VNDEMIDPQATQRPRPPKVNIRLESLRFSGAWTKAREGLFAHRLMIYICVLLVASIGAWGYGIRTRTIFSCPADGYDADRYVAYCNGVNYADYEHGAFQFNLEPSVRDSVRHADVVFLGNSRTQVAFSTAPTEQWFSANSSRYYLMGFGSFENALFEGELLDKVHPHAKVYIINVDGFFETTEAAYAKAVLDDPRALDKYRVKRSWQRVHARICGTFAALCGHQFVIYRSRDTGEYHEEGQWGRAVPVSYDSRVNQDLANASIATAVKFLSHFTRNKCVILTIVPTVDTPIGTASAIASGVGLKLVTPGSVQGLQTYDGSHLAQPSARRWAEAFFRVAGPQIRSCVNSANAAARQGPLPGGAAVSGRSATTSFR